ncbi:hypothetical protein TUM12370_24690 [Salmonella enterica subsp. enterica serovar Choleraesuis]|nr:hypothetical protein TUM12370_24690 [Salmonella enterica subsp. enterica serovar Choleraesuis]
MIMTVIVECIEGYGDWTVGHRYAGELEAGGFIGLKSDDPEDDYLWSADSRQEYDRGTDTFATLWFLPGIDGVLFREVEQ